MLIFNTAMGHRDFYFTATSLNKKLMKGICILKTVLLFVMLMWTGRAMAQSTDAGIRGTVTDASGDPVPGATVQVRNESTGFNTGTITNGSGQFNFVQLPLGGPYSVTVSYVGYTTQKKTGVTLSQAAKISLDIEISDATTELNEVVVNGDGFVNRIERFGSATSIGAQQIKNLPLEGRNFTGLTSLSPLQGGGAINLAGQRRTSTNITVDGVNARNQLTAGELGRGPYTISQEAIKEFEVVTNSYDVTLGRQGGGAINAVTKSGTNTLSGTGFFYHRNDNLASKFDIRGNDRSAKFYNSQWGFSLGGPIIKDKAHFFVAFDRQDAGEPLFIADLQTAADEQRIGIKRDTLNKFLTIARNQYGVSNSQQTGQFDRKTTANTFFARIDWQLNARNKLTIRNNFSNWDSPLSVDDNSTIDLKESYSDFSSMENSLLLSLRSVVRPEVINEFKVQYQHAERDFVPNGELPSVNIPRAIVRVASPFPTESNPNATRSVTVQFGGQRFTPETNLERQVQLVNTTYISKGKANFTLGTDNMITYLETLLSNEQNGRFFFNSLSDFQNFEPNRYVREVPVAGLPIVKQTVMDLSVFAQSDFPLARNVQAMLGVRWDATAFMDAAQYNPAVDQELGIRTDNKPSDWNNIQPRFQLTWNVKGENRSILRVGGGVFSAQPHYYAQVNNIQNSGAMLASIDVSQADLIPFPDFPSYREDPSTVPGIPEGATAGVSTINAVSDDFQVPTIYKANISFNHLIGDFLNLGVNVLGSKAVNNYVYQDVNLVDQPFFRIDEEANRGVFVPAATITNRGQTDWLNSRKSDDVGRALLLTSEGELNQWAVVLEANYRIGADGYFNVSYTRNMAKDNSSYNCCVANTSTFLPVVDDPRALNFGYSDNHFKEKLVVNGASPTIKGFTLGATLTGFGGTRYSFIVTNGSMNGDFVLNNDLAYVFDPNNPQTPADIAEGFRGILDDPETAESTKEYLRANFGKVAERNGGENPFAATLDVRLSKIFKTFKGQSIEFSADLFNVGNMLSREWGRSYNFGGTRNLLRITGFDQEEERYLYSVESGVGTKPVNGTSWRLQLGVRYNF